VRDTPVKAIASIVLAALLLTGCQFSIDVGPSSTSEGAEMAVWDLTETNDVAAIGWPEDHEERLWQRTADQGLERIVLPEGIVLEGFDRANPGRAGGIGGAPLADRFRDMVVAYSNRPVAEIRDIAIELAEEVGADPDIYVDWAARNAAGADYSAPAANRARTGSITIGHLTLALDARAAAADRASLYVNLFWLSESAPDPDET
jgi:hypothetical protein